jgi:hypothetical protein
VKNQRFTGLREAKEFLVSKIIEEAGREGCMLSDVERRMLYFSETGWSLPDIEEVGEAFDREYDQTGYERKIARIIVNLHRRLKRESKPEYFAWIDAIRIVGKEDHYVLVMIKQSGISIRPPGDLLRLWVTAFSICMLVLVISLSFTRINLKLTREEIGFYLEITAACAVGAYLLSSTFFGRQRTDDLLSKVVDKILGFF